MTVSTEAAGGLFAFGVVMLYLEFAFPEFAQLNPLGRWFGPSGPESSRVSRIFGALCCVIFALHSVGTFRGAGEQYVLPLVFVGCVMVMAHDLLVYWGKSPPSSMEPSPPTSKVKSKSKKK